MFGYQCREEVRVAAQKLADRTIPLLNAQAAPVRWISK
jgi:hypothetical protein